MAIEVARMLYFKQGVLDCSMLVKFHVAHTIAYGTLRLSETVNPAIYLVGSITLRNAAMDLFQFSARDRRRRFLYRTDPLFYHKFGKMVIFWSGNVYLLCSPGNQYHKIINCLILSSKRSKPAIKLIPINIRFLN